jgi:hypothetical protein
MKRRNLRKNQLDATKFDMLVRFMIVAAENTRLVQYSEITKVFGISLEDIRDYAAFLGVFCRVNKYPLLNSLIINTKDGMPGDDFFTWASDTRDNWGNHIASCFSGFHRPLGNANRFNNTSGISGQIARFLNDR